MKPVVGEDLIKRLCLLAKLEPTAEEKEQVRQDLEKMLGYVSCLEEVDVEEVEPLYQVLPGENVFREDEITNAQESAWLWQNAPAVRDSLFLVPRTIGDAPQEAQ